MLPAPPVKNRSCRNCLATVTTTAGVDDVNTIAREIAAAGSDGICILSVVFIVSMNEIPVLEIGYAVKKKTRMLISSMAMSTGNKAEWKIGLDHCRRKCPELS